MSFDRLPTSTPLGDGRWRLEYSVIYSGRTDEWIIPSGFVHDWASIPRWLWPIAGPVSNYGASAVMHDWMYRTQPVSRKDADGLFRRTLKEAGVGWFRRRSMYLAVRVFGGGAWKRCGRVIAESNAEDVN